MLKPPRGSRNQTFFWVFSGCLFFIVCVCFLVFWVVHVSWFSGKPRKPSKTTQTSKSTTTSLVFVALLVFLVCLVFLVVLVALAVLVSLVVLVFSVLRGVHSTNRTSETYSYTLSCSSFLALFTSVLRLPFASFHELGRGAAERGK